MNHKTTLKMTAIWAVMLLICFGAYAQTTRTWNGSAGSDWFNANNWTPAGVPAANDTINFASGTINLTAPVTVSGQFSWTGGTLTGNPLTISSTGILTLSGSNTKYLQNVLTNAGTVTWSGGTFYVQNNGTPSYVGGIENQAGALFDITSDQALSSYFGGSSAYFRNAGTLQKSSGTGTSTIGVSMYNAGSVSAQQGVLSFQGGGTIENSFNAAAGAWIRFQGGAFSYTVPPVLTGSGSIQLTGGTLTLLEDVIPNLQLQGGTVTLSPSFQGGSITNLNCNSQLSGNYSVTGVLNLGGGMNGDLSITGTGVTTWTGGTMNGAVGLAGGSVLNWNGGTADGPITVANGATMVLGGTATKYLANVLTNLGTVTWSNGTIYVQNNGTATYAGAIENLAGGLFDVACDQNLSSYFGGTNAYVHNLGTLQKSAGGGTANVSVALYNGGLVLGQQGILNFQNGRIIEGNFTAEAGSTIRFSGGVFSYGVVPVVTGPGTVQFTGGTLTLLDNTIPNLQLVGGTLNLGAGFQGGTITNLNCSSQLSGNYSVTGVLNLGGGMNGDLSITGTGVVTWTGGTINGAVDLAGGSVLNWNGGTAGGPITVASGGTMLLGGTATKYLANVLTNRGTVTWTNGTVYLQNNGTATYAGAIENLAGGLFDVACDQNLSSYFGGTNAYVHNLGTVQKSAGGGTTSVNTPLDNAGQVVGQQGILNFQNGRTIEGSFTAAAGATVRFSGGTFAYTTPPVMTGPGAIQFTGGTLTLLDDIIPNLQLVDGTVNLSPGFQGGSITNFNFGGTLNGSYTVTGLLNLGGGVNGALTIRSNGVVNWTGGTITGGIVLTNGSVLTWSAGTLQQGLEVVPGAIVNFNGGTASGPITVDSGAALLFGGTATKYLANVLTNRGTVTWTNGTVYLQNNGTATYAGAIENMVGGLFDIACDQGLSSYFGGTNAYVHNLGTLQKSAGGGTTSVSAALFNGGLVLGQQGILNFQNGRIIEGNFTAEAGATIRFSGGIFSYEAAPVITGPGTTQFTGGTLTLLDDIIPNLQLVDGTLNLSPAFQGGSITNLNFGGTLNGSYTVGGLLNLGGGVNGALTIRSNGVVNWTGGTITGGLILTNGSMLTWSAGTLQQGLEVVPGAMVNFNGGTASGPITVDSGAALLFGGTATKYLANVLTNRGTVTWTNGTVYLQNNGTASYAGGIENFPGGLWDIRCNQSLANYFGNPNAFFHNLGVVQKTAGGGTTTISVPFANAGMLSFFSGILNFSSGTYAPTGATLNYGLSGPGQPAPLSLAGNLSLDGTLSATLINGYTPKYGDNIPLISCGSRSNSFNALILPAPGNNLGWRAVYTATGASLQVITNSGTTAQISGFVRDGNSAPISNITVAAFNTNSNNSLFLSTVTDVNGHYLLDVTNGVWRVGLQGLAARGYNDVLPQDVTINNASQTANFVVQPYTGQSYTISVTPNPAAGGNASGGGVFLPGSLVTLIATPDTTSLPYFFTGWFENSILQSSANPYVFPAQRDRQLTANFTLPQFTVTVSNNPTGGGAVSGAGSYFYGSTNILTAQPNFGYRFGWWSEDTNILGTSLTLTTVIYTNHSFVANYTEANTNHVVTTVTQPPGLAIVSGAGTYTNGQTGTFTAPSVVVNGAFDYFFQKFLLTNTVVSTSNSFNKTFSTIDPTNLQYVAVYASLGVVPAVTNVSANLANPVPATTNFQLAFRFDRSMDTNVLPQVTITNPAPGATQPIVPAGGRWGTVARINDTFYAPSVTFSSGMDGTLPVAISGAQDPLGVSLARTNVYTVVLDATPPVLSSVAAAPSVLSSFVTWDSDEPASSMVEYGTTTSYGSSSAWYTQLVLAHGVTLNNLTPTTTYHFRVHSRDQAGNETISGDNVFTTFAAPDLQVTGLSVTGDLISGGHVVIGWSDTNSGSGNTFNYWYDRVIVTNSTSGQTLLNSSVFYDANANGSVAPGNSRARQLSFTLPNGPAGAGNLQILVTVNAYGNQYEANSSGSAQTNNTASALASSTLAAYPDLQVTGLSITNLQVRSGKPVGLVWNDANTGNSGVSNNFSDRILVVNQTTAKTLVDTYVSQNAAVNPIGAGQSLGRQFSFVLPDGTAGSGSLQITVTADTFNNVFEYNTGGTGELNNTNSMAAVSSLAPYADLAVTNVLVPAIANAGAAIAVSWTETNLGAGPATNTWYDQVFITDTNIVGGGQFLGSFPITNGLQTGGSLTITQSVALPRFVQGNRWLVIKANASGAFYELDTTNNSAVSTQAVTITPTLVLSLSRATVSEAAGTNSVSGTLTRNGDLSAPLNVSLATVTGTNLFIPASVTIPAGQSAANFLFGPIDYFIAANPIAEAVTATASGFSPSSAPLTILQDDPTTLTLNLSASSVNEDAGTNAILGTVTRNANFGAPLTVMLISDNTGALRVPASVTIPAGQASATFGLTPVPVQGLSDTRRAHVSASATGFSSVSIEVQVLNVNTVQLSLSLLKTTVNKGAGNAADVGTVSMASPLASAQSVQLSVQGTTLLTIPSTVTIPAGATSVNFNISVANDNLATGPQTGAILARPLTPARVAVTNGQATATLQILDVNGPTLALYPAQSTISKGSNTLITITRNTLPTNSVTVTLGSSPSGILDVPPSVVLPLNQTSATFSVTGVLDQQQTGPRAVTVTASAAGFNSGGTPMTVSDIYLPDLVPTSITVATNGLTSSQMSLSWVVANRGLGAATNQVWRDYVYLAGDSLGQSVVLAALATNTSGLQIGASYTNQATFFTPGIPGNYWIMVVADGGKVVSELNKQNNSLIWSEPVSLSPVYRAEINNVTPPVATAGSQIVLSGRTYNPTNNQPIPNKIATVRVVHNGARRIYTVVSDGSGNFSYVFQPLASEAGNYDVGADYPYTLADPVQGSFVLLGMQAQPASLNHILLPDVPVTGQLLLSNLSDHPLTGLTVSVPDLQGNLDAQFSFTNHTLPGNGVLGIDYSLQSSLTRNAQIRFTAAVTSTEGAQVALPVTVNVVPLVPKLVANPGYLTSGMLVGDQTIVSFDIVNNGGADSGDLSLTLPTNLTWISLGCPATIPSIPAGGKATVTLLLNPPADLPLTLYTGNLAAYNGNVGLSVQFQFRAVSSATGDLQVKATDDYTYYVAGGPAVTNATVTIRDPFTSAVIAQTNTDASGIAYFTALPAGPYTVDATATKHNQFRGSANVVPGTVVELEAFMPRQLVTYQWSVVPTEIPDNYKIVLESVFETEVPVPNVVIEEPRVMIPVAPGVASQFTMKLSNHGLIAANGVKINVPQDPKYLITPMVTDVGIIPAESSVEVPVTVELRSAPGLAIHGAKGGYPKDIGCSLSDLNACLPDIPLGVTYYYVCGPNNVLQQRSMDLSVICTAKSVKDCLDNLKDALSPSDNLLSLGCDALSALLACSGADLSPCQQAAISTACGAAVGALEGGPLGAAAGGLSGGGSDLLQCLCTLLNNISLPSIPGSGGGGGFGIGFGGGGGGGGWVVSGGGVSTGSSTGGCSSPGSPSGFTGGQTSLPKFLSRLKVPSKTQGVCARVRIRIEQSVTLTRTAFRGTLEMDNGGDSSLTGIQVNLDFRDATNGVAASKFAIEGPVVSGMTAVDGTGMLAGGASGSAVYTFVPTLDAAPDAPATYQIGGTLSYVDNGEVVTVPLLSAPITVYPEARLDLLYFQQRDVYADDPFTPQIEPSEPFSLGLIVKNSGAGMAHNFQITSGQPQIVDNQKGLLINFSIIGTEVGDQPRTPSLTANLGDIAPGGAKEVTWAMLSTLQGKFISFNASFEHVNDLGSTNTSLINSVEIHELIHPVLANRTGDDDIPDFLVNDVPDPASLPDVLYLSDGSSALVTSVTNGTFDSQAGPGHLQVHLQATAGNGWNYFQLPDPGVGFRLDHVVRSDGKVLPLTNNAWTTFRSFPSSSTGAFYENLLHLFDYAGTGSYTIFYHSTNTTPPGIVAVGPITPFTQSSAISSVPVVFSEPIDTNTFSYANVTLTRNGGANLITSGSGITLAWLSNTTYSIGGLASLTAVDGNYQLTVNGSGIYDLWGNNAGSVSASTQWAKGNAAAVVQSLSPVSPDPRNIPVGSVTVTFSKPINAPTFTSQALSLTVNGGPNLISPGVSITAQSSTVYVIEGLGALSGAEGTYALSVDASTVQDTGGANGTGSQTISWDMITTPPAIASLERITTNPRNIVVRTLDVTFSEPIDPATFDYHDVTLTRDGGPNLITGDVTVERVNPTTFRVGNISWVQGYAGNYSFTVDASGVMDLAGNVGTGTTNETWQIILEVPPTPTNLVAAPDLGISATDGLTSTNQVTITGTVAGTNLTVRMFDATAKVDLGTAVVTGTNFAALLSFTTEGAHRLQFTAVDIAGNVSPPAFLNLFIDVIAPTAIFQPVLSPAYGPVSNLVVTFSEPINTNTLLPGNFVARFNGGNPITPTLTPQTSNTFLLGGLGAYTAPVGSYQVTLNMNGIQDLAGNQSTNVVTVSWVRSTTNVAPVLTALSDLVVPPDGSVAFQVKASDANGDMLSYSLGAGAPPTASIDPVSGFLFWNPTRAYAQTTNFFTVIVTDNGSPSMSTTQAFSVIVLDYLDISLGATNLQSGESASLPLYLASNGGVTNVSFALVVPQDLLTNWTLTPVAPQLGSATLQNQVTNLLIGLSTVAGQSLQGTQLVSRLNFMAASNHVSALISLPLLNITGRKPTGAAYSNYVAHAGSVALVQDQPFLVGTLSTNSSRTLLLYGRLGASYQVQYTTNLAPALWQPLINYVQTNGVLMLPVEKTNPAAFYRLQQQ